MNNMVLIDESGDPSSTPNSSIEFTMTATVINDPARLIPIVKKYPCNTRYPNELSNADELKYNNSNDSIRKNVISEIISLNPSIHAVHIRKNEIRGKSAKSTYFHLAKELLNDVMKDQKICDSNDYFDIIFDESEYFKSTDAKELSYKAAKINGIDKVTSAYTKSSKRCICLQAHDFIAGSIGNKYLNSNLEDFKLISKNTSVRTVHYNEK